MNQMSLLREYRRASSSPAIAYRNRHVNRVGHSLISNESPNAKGQLKTADGRIGDTKGHHTLALVSVRGAGRIFLSSASGVCWGPRERVSAVSG